jgi:tRNA threonylcarbamoyladenosine biosynthesis protein TsaE
MNTQEHITHSAEETMALGRKLAPTLKAARMVILRGDLGTGKTTLVKGIAERSARRVAGRCHQPHVHPHP